MIINAHVSEIRREAKKAGMSTGDVDIERHGDYCSLGGMTIRGLAFVRMGAKYNRPERTVSALILNDSGEPECEMAVVPADMPMGKIADACRKTCSGLAAYYVDGQYWTGRSATRAHRKAVQEVLVRDGFVRGK